jgi:hypothetical protein
MLISGDGRRATAKVAFRLTRARSTARGRVGDAIDASLTEMTLECP